MEGGASSSGSGTVKPLLGIMPQPPAKKRKAMDGKGRILRDAGAGSSSDPLESLVDLQNPEVLTVKFYRDSVNGTIFMEDGTPLSEVMNYVADLRKRKEYGDQPFRGLELTGWRFNSWRAQSERFWKPTGSHLISLDLQNCRFSGADEFWRMTYSLCPQLNRLCLRDCSFGSQPSGGPSGEQPQQEYKEPVRGKHEHLKCLIVSFTELPVTWLELVSHFQSLDSLEVRGQEHDAGSDLVAESLLDAINLVRRQDGSKLALKHFDVRPFGITQDRTSHQKFILLQQLNISLKSLIVRADPDLNLEFVGDILKLHSGSLEQLMLKVWEVEDYESRAKLERFPCPVQLDKLLELKIDDVLLESTEILKSAPNLQRLYISGEDGERTRMKSVCNALTEGLHDNSPALLPKLTKLSNSGNFGGMQILTTLAKLMPNLEELEMTLLDSEFWIVCQNWKGLQVLSVNVEREVDGDKVLEPLTDNGLTGGSLQVEQMMWVHKAVHPNITDLKELRSFSCDSEELTGISVYHGFLKLPNLKTLTLPRKYNVDDADLDTRAGLQPLCFGKKARKDLRQKGITLNFN